MASVTPQGQTLQSVSGRRTFRASRYATPRATPFLKTPMSRRIHVVSSKLKHKRGVQTPKDSSESAQKEKSSRGGNFTLNRTDFVNKAWNIYKVSPLYQFSHRSKDLKYYARLLSAFIKSQNSKGMACEIDETANSASFSLCPGLKLLDSEPESVQITLKKTGRGSSDDKVVLVAVLTSVHAPAASVDHTKFTVLPVMLCRGPALLSSQLQIWLEATFDCCISKFSLSPLSLSWIVAMWSGYLADKGSNQPVVLEYGMPEEVENLSNISLKIDARDCQRLWECIHNLEDDNFHLEEVEGFMEAIEKHFFHHFGIHLSALKLRKVGTGIVFVAAEGRIRIFSGSHIQLVLSHLTEVAIEQVVNV